jgi:integrase
MSRKRRGRNEGSVFKRADGRWSASVTVGVNANGKRVRKVVYGATKAEAQEKLLRLQSAKLDGMLADSGKLTVAAFLAQWLEDSARPTIRDATYASYKGIVDNHMSPKIGGIRLDRLTPAHVLGLYAALEREGESCHIRRLCHAVLRRSLKQAVKWGMVPRNVCDAVEPPRVAKKEIQPLDGEQVAKLLCAAEGDRLEAIFVLAVATGLRFGELAGLQWSDVDLDAGAITVRRTLSEVNGNLKLAEPKTKKSRRRVELPAIAVDALCDHRKRMLAEGHFAQGQVFVNSKGRLLRRSHFRDQQFLPLLKRAGLPTVRFHDLRHTAATLLLCEGVHPKIVQERLGHSQISVTLDTYSHVLPTMQRDAADRLDTMFKAGADKLKAAQQSAAAAG